MAVARWRVPIPRRTLRSLPHACVPRRFLAARLLAVATAIAACRGGETGHRTPSSELAPASRPIEGPRAAATVNGTLTLEHGQRVLRVWGTPQQMGYAHGALLRDGILAVVQDYALDVVPPAALTAAAGAMGRTAAIAPSLRDEAAGVIEGMRDHGGAFVPALARELSVDDLLALNAMTDLLAIGCSSLSTWGDATAAAFDGAAVVVRNLDWSTDPDLLAQQLVIVTMPSDPQRQSLVSVGFAGYLACLSCINEAGVTALFNMGYGDGAASALQALAGFAPANLLVRDALERRDTDGDGRSTADDVEASVRAATHAGSWILHVVEPATVAAAAVRSPARVLEVEADGVVTRTPSEGEGPDAIASDHLAATNHFRAKRAPTSCPRYRELANASRRQPAVDADALWRMGHGVRLPEVVQSMIVDADHRALSLWLRRANEDHDSDAPPVAWTWSELVRPEARE